jgi:molybdopterin-guanine dinucleotide biosynthesis protein A
MPPSDANAASSSAVCAAILAGGRASRYGGRPKGLLHLPEGITIIERTIEVVRHAGIQEIVIVAGEASPYRDVACTLVPDRRPDRGPLAGIEAALEHYADRCDAVLILPCDLPGITREVVTGLVDAAAASAAPVVVAETGDGFWHPLCSVVRIGALETVRDALDAGSGGVHALWRRLGAATAHFEEELPFLNVNTPEDMERWLASREETDRR